MKRKSTSLILFLFGFALVFMVGCATENGTSPTFSGPTSDDYDDLAEDLGATLASADDGVLDTRPMMDFDSNLNDIPAPPGDQPVCHDTTFQRNGITITIDLTFYDAAGIESEVYDSLTTVRMTREMTIEGTIEGFQRTATINHHSLLERDHIAPSDTVSIINGTATRMVSSTFMPRWRPLERHIEAEHHLSKNQILVGRDRELYPYPISGTIEGNSTITRSAERFNDHREATLEIGYTLTFDGTRYARMEMDNGFVYWIDLDTGESYRERPDEP